MEPVRHQQTSVILAPDALTTYVAEIFEKAGCSQTEAGCIATRLVGANLRGHDSHGVIRVPRYVDALQRGLVHAGQTVDVITENDVMAVLDGKFGFGQWIGEQAVDAGIEKARANGVAIIALRNSGHLGRIGDWAERAAAQGLVSIHMVNVKNSLLVAPFGGRDRRMSTSPFCAGIPMPSGIPVVLDFATSAAAEGKALVALSGGKPLPEGALITADGSLTNDPLHLYGPQSPDQIPNPNLGPGALRTFGDHKGSGLNFLMEIMAGALTGTGANGPIVDKQKRNVGNGMLSIYMAPAVFGSTDGFATEVRNYIDFVKSSRPAEAGGEVLVPGEKELKTMAQRSADGLPLSENAWQNIVSTGDQVGAQRPG
ncbi:MAG: malate/lactate/ureidoglycolate dehydrogenase [Rhodospirillales bacterium]|nr:malate/lactate/ureidoglycolate dehydrogenase [Rhodospirillales bacterium]